MDYKHFKILRIGSYSATFEDMIYIIEYKALPTSVNFNFMLKIIYYFVFVFVGD